MERLGEETLREVKLSVADISDDLPKYVEGFVLAPLVIDDSHEAVLSLVSKIVSLLYNGSYKRVAVRDRDTLERIIRLASEYIKQVALHLAVELRVFELDHIAFIIYHDRKIMGMAVVTRSSMYNDYGDTDESRGAVIIMTSEKLRAYDIDKILSRAQDLAEFYGSRLGMKIPNIIAIDDVRVVNLAIEEQDVVKIRMREDYGKPVTLKIPVLKPLWTVEDLPQKLREDIQTLIIDPMRSGARYAPRGLIIVGPPGVGKSVTAEALAHAMDKSILRLSPSTYRSMWYGMTEKTLHKIFAAVKKRHDLVILVDDADFLVQRLQAIHEAYIAEVNVWLNILQDPSRPFTVMTTNVPDLLDPALIRPGRLDIAMLMGYPDREMRMKISLRAAKRYGVALDSETAIEIARITRWFNAAEIDALIRMA
ncbi:MAG TPA: ATP-binding protein, partial [Ignisphaera sp.]|nr:ATP-binding protein [Ignisphaera sp.]